jgi:hypothetical protein
MTNLKTIHSFLLVDSALLAADALAPDSTSTKPDWLLPVYNEAAESVSPLVIDILAAYDSGQLAVMMTMLNAASPQVHASLIDTSLPHSELVQHLRRFIMIRTDDGRALTLRFADCLGLPVLATTFSSEQWMAFTGPIERWCIHDRDGVLRDLPLSDRHHVPASTPLVLTARQLESLAEATAPDEMIADIREMRHNRGMPGSMMEQHRWASAARQLWRNAGNVDKLVLRWLTAAALDTRGAVLSQHQVPSLLALDDKDTIRVRLDEAAAQVKAPLRCEPRGGTLTDKHYGECP